MDTNAVLIATMHHRRSTLERALVGAGWQPIVYHDVGAALEHLRTRPYAAVFCDEYLRGASARGFLVWSRRIAPDVPFYIIAVTGDTTSLGSHHRPDGVLPFPPDEAAFPRPLKASGWDAPAAASRDLPLEGRTDLVRLGDLIEMLVLTATSSVIALGGGLIGRVYLREGQLEHAVSMHDDVETSGVRGLARLLDLDDVAFQVLPYRAPSRRTVHVPTTAALVDAARLVDEQRRDAALLDAVRANCRDATGVAVGYPLSERPSDSRGEGQSAFTLGVNLLDAVKQPAGQVSHLALESEHQAVAAVRFGEDRLLAALAPRGRSMVLLSALAKAVRQHGR